MLYENPPVDLNGPTPTGGSFLSVAGAAGQGDICHVLLGHGANPNEVSGVRCHSLLHTAIAGGNYGFASLLLNAGAAPSPQNSSMSTPLHFAARSNQQYMAEKLLKHGADLLIRDSAGRTAVDLAIEKGHVVLANVIESRLLNNVRDYSAEKLALREALPKINRKPVAGSANRILIYKNGIANWEGEDIDPNEAIPD